MEKPRFRKIVSALIVFAMLLWVVATLMQVAMADIEPNDSFAQAELIISGTHPGSLGLDPGPDDTADYYQIVVSAGQTISVNATPASTLGLYLDLYDSLQNYVISDYGNPGVMVKLAYTTNSEQTSYTYYIVLTIRAGDGTYSMGVSLVSQNDANSGGDAGDSFAAATQLASANATYSGFLKDMDTNDYYTVNITAGQTLSVSAQPANTLSTAVFFYNPARVQVAYNQTAAGVLAMLSWTTNSAQTNYTYYIRLNQWSGYGTYSLAISIISQNDAGSKGDAGDDLSTATPVNAGTYSGSMKDEDTDDCYKILQNVPAGQGLYIRVIPSETQPVEIRIYDLGKVLQASGSGLAGATVNVGTRAATTGSFYIRVKSLSSYGSYAMLISLEPSIDTPTHKPVAPDPSQNVTVSVNVTAVQKGVSSVTLYYSTNNVTWTNATMTLNATTGLYEGTIPKLTLNTHVYYKITAYDTVGDYFTQDKAGQYYTYTVIPEFPTAITILIIFFLLTLAMILSKRKTQHQSVTTHQLK